MQTRRPRSSRTGRATMADVARAAGTSAITVSRALRNPDKVGEELRGRIAEACRRLGYVPNRAASALASARSMNIAVLIPSLTNEVFVDTLVGIEEVLDPLGYQMLIGVTNYAPAEEERRLRAQLANDPDGILLTGLNHTPEVRDLLRGLSAPAVHMMDLSENGEHWTVGFSQVEAGAAAARHLIARGRRRIAIVASQLDPRTLRRIEGCRRALEAAGLHDPALELLVPDPSSIGLGARLVERLLHEHPDCDGVFLNNDDLAQGAVFGCGRLGIAVPGRLAVVGFNDLAGSAWTVPPLTTVATPRREVGRAAARLLVERIEGAAATPRRIDLGFQLVVRESA